MADNVIKFGKTKKALKKKRDEAKAAENRVKFGRKKSQKNIEKAEAKKSGKHLDAHKLSGDDET